MAEFYPVLVLVTFGIFAAVVLGCSITDALHRP